MTAPILLTGGTGTLGRLVAPLLHDAGCKVRILSRDASREPTDGIEYVTGDLTTGEGIEAAVTGADTVVHCAGTMTGDGDKAQTLVRAATRAGVRHLAYVSVVGADRVPVVSRVDRAMFGYFESKRAAELVVTESGLPWSILRATQFNDLILTTARQLSRLPVTPVFAGVRFQPVDARDVAARLAEVALGEPLEVLGQRLEPDRAILRCRVCRARQMVSSLRMPGRGQGHGGPAVGARAVRVAAHGVGGQPPPIPV